MIRFKIILLSIFIIIAGACSSDTQPETRKSDSQIDEKPTRIQDTVNRRSPPVYYKPFDHRYSGGGFYALVDGKYGGLKYNDGMWQGYRDNDMDVVIDLGSESKISSVSGNFLRNHEGWIFLPASFTVLSSNDMKEFTLQGIQEFDIPSDYEEDATQKITISGLDINARYLRIKAATVGAVPAWHKSAEGRPSWVFIDEITIDFD